ncbi:AAA family ATPase [Polynucleobacter sp. MWH-UH24A]|uniref:AAA family ATPase n=1 Tax=Polynucleobacter sp. MWH-UH24A TaxID=2689110 RepID=UPI001BFCF6DE|nr:AAA family ATPase [Polynucleobacter sp. MWH-UH24A]QWD76644.1 AAA family ATPase [Polynucleobacter sp. MWH-UH24A]
MKQLLSEYLRPKSFHELCISDENKEKLEFMYENSRVMNMLFHGKPGTGKTSSSLIFYNSEKFDSIIINGSLETGVDEVRNRVRRYSSTLSLFPDKQRLVIIDECDYLSPNSQSGLRKLIEDNSDTCRFIFTCNEIKKIQQPLISRLLVLNFDVTPSIIKTTLESYRKRVIQKLKDRYGEINVDRVNYIINYYFPDYRIISNQLEYEFLLNTP